jgi:hypothetical protein
MVSQGSNATESKAPEQSAPKPTPSDAPLSTERVMAALSSFHDWVLRPRVRLTLIGVGLLLIGALMLTNSVWTLPLVIVGALMVAIAWVGHRLEGRFAVQWGESGTELAFRAQIRAPGTTRRPILLDPPSPDRDPPPVDKPAAREGDDVIDGNAHTVEIEVAELEALIAAADLRDTQDPAPNGNGDGKGADRLRAAYGPSRRSDTPG